MHENKKELEFIYEKQQFNSRSKFLNASVLQLVVRVKSYQG